MGKMKRIDLIYDTVKKLDKGNGVTTNQLCEVLNIERSNISKNLNLLIKNGELFKNSSRPVKYYIKDTSNIDFTYKSPLDNLSYLYPSLTEATKLAKTAILYPPNGMNSLIIGETGSGKSMLAKLMHEYAVSFFNNKDIPFIHFNCSDYANNVQLLSSHLFGVKKGTFTGASEDRAGLIEKANGGILFLDEIHNLPNEGQEMLFLFMDTGYFRRFGEVSKKIKSDVRIICATNEDINQKLLSTFLRRISIKIKIPTLRERSLEERLTLIETFLKEESANLDKPVYISYNAMLCFLSYDCPYNVGQLRNDVKLAVANAYTEYFINNKKQIKINSPDLPKDMLKNISNPLVKENSLLNKLNSTNRYFVYDKNTTITSYSYQRQKHSMFSSYKNLLNQAEIIASNKNSSIEDFNKILFDYLDSIQDNCADYKHNFSYSTFDEINSELCNFNKSIEKLFKYKMYESLFNIHIDLIYDRMTFITLDTISLQNKLKSLFQSEYNLASEYLDIIENNLNLYLSNSEFILIILICIYIMN
ncbi:sigma-54-dependent transcriptional regulator [Clostridium sp. Ade.TY]|uniref:sigma 54-interacting transcriptional regulator n=1 Tax=Clostridium sp. Ade.TY TaxID=1391647 RepID=UPI0003FE6E36|nr:sigma-54-dependent transcriptional regulator [Clostridium sp. Ade.TY]